MQCHFVCSGHWLNYYLHPGQDVWATVQCYFSSMSMPDTLCSLKVAGDKGISEAKSKQQSPCSNYMHRHVTSWGNACSTCMHKPVRCMHQLMMLQADACTYCMGSKVSNVSRIYLYSSYFVLVLCLWNPSIGICGYLSVSTQSELRQDNVNKLLKSLWTPEANTIKLFTAVIVAVL